MKSALGPWSNEDGNRFDMKKWVVYMLRCKGGSLYTGMTNDLASRIKKHNLGDGAKYTRSRRPVKLVWSENKRSESAARRREAQIKSWPREKKLALIKSS